MTRSAYGGLCALLLGWFANCLAGTFNSAVFDARYYFSIQDMGGGRLCWPNGAGCPPPLTSPGFLTIDDSWQNASASGFVGTGAGPSPWAMAILRYDANHGPEESAQGAYYDAGPQVTFSVRLEKLLPHAPDDEPIPVVVTARGLVQATVTSETPANIGWSVGQVMIRFNPGTGAAPWSIVFRASSFDGPPAEIVDIEQTFLIPLTTAEHPQVTVSSSASVSTPYTGHPDYAPGSFWSIAYVSPSIKIDPVAEFSLNGVPTRFSDAYRIVYSDGLIPEIAGQGSGMSALSVACRNFNTGALTASLPTPTSQWTCGAEDFVSSSGDLIGVAQRGVAETGAFGGTVGNSLRPLLGVCINRTTGQHSVVFEVTQQAWDCVAQNVSADPNDVLETFVLGIVR